MVEHPDPWSWRQELAEQLGPLLTAGGGRTGAARRPQDAGEARPEAGTASLLSALGGRLAEDLRAPEDVPALPVSAMDGFAVRAADVDPAGPTVLPVLADIPAAPGGARRLSPGTAARIMTGAPVPTGADAVIEVERTDAARAGAAPAKVRIGPVPQLRPGRHVRRPGEEIPRGAVIAPARQEVTPGLVAVAAMLGLGRLPLAPGLPSRTRADGPRVAVLVTGDEVLPGHDIAAGQADGAVRDSNGVMLAAALAELGARALPRRCSDAPAPFLRSLREAAEEADLVLTTGGIGHGAFDVVKAVLGEGGTGGSRFAHLALRPGGPQGRGTLARADGSLAPLVHLPGTPVGALVGFHLFVRPLLGAGEITQGVLGPIPEAARPQPGRRGSGGAAQTRLHALPAVLEEHDDAGHGAPRALLLPGRRLAPFARADALVLLELAPGQEAEEGAAVPVVRLGA
ncbi:molybdopterin molybdotransferase MoeA [Brachybacterium phenoliresistens]|uniref:Molybdopterin molybdenumtransferase n=1 Tax=Brachybacterium phenoliresistens TaxID=396014 RepID=Z9JVQ8_9MICO|nr:molybdopterin molybdotransferase MoeA [Brachybacterium phenoliresistens]EWS81881.1 molybdenum cofactor synthesis protein [Brachybacterium phenoliresistens]